MADLLAPLGRVHRGWYRRPAQETMAREIALAIRDGATLLIDAPTGIGKSLAALAPIAAQEDASRRAAYCTATIALQEQLISKDLPLVHHVFGRPDSSLLKGFRHYLCRLKYGLWTPDLLDEAGAVEAFNKWVNTTGTGDVADLPARPRWWPNVAASHEDCLGSGCTHFPPPHHPGADKDGDEARDGETEEEDGAPPCFAILARRAAVGAPLVVTNHHLLLMLQRYTPEAVPSILVIDEGHRLSQAAASVYGVELDERRFFRLADRLARDVPDLAAVVSDATEAYHELLRAIPPPKDEPALLGARPEGLARLQRHLTILDTELETIGGLRARLGQADLTRFREALDLVMTPDGSRARWVDLQQAQRRFHAVPIETGPHLAPVFRSGKPRIVMSATLAAGSSFAHVERACGITHARHLRLPPCFDYARQMRYFLPLPPLNPQRDVYLDAAGSILHQLVLASRGRALVLCTAFRQVEAMDAALDGIPYPVLKGDEHTGSLAEAFRDDVHSVLIGTARYWEGLDVPGPSCSLVVIVRLPFDRPDPLTQARYAAAEQRGLSWFQTLALPDAIVKLRQGVGRLIRTETDRGVVAILDGRVETKRYGRTILDALPQTGILRRVDEVAAFLQAMD